MPNKLKIDERLMRLMSSGLCPQEGASKYAEELRQLADAVARVDEAEKRSRVFKALADPTRLRILMLLGIREMCVCEVMIALGLTQPTASHHLGILENAGLVKSRKEGKWVFYKIANPKLIENMRELGIT
ncbi:MAG: ArsR/SmtB family transcription factor [Candidatus Bathyarchaeales archaeon]